jgi:hypothetical protein
MVQRLPPVAGRGQRPRDRGYPFRGRPPRRRSLSTPRGELRGLLRRTDPLEWDPKSTNISFRGLSKLAFPERQALVGKCLAVHVYLLEWLKVGQDFRRVDLSGDSIFKALASKAQKFMGEISDRMRAN